MPSRQTLPRLWLMTDDRLGAEYEACLERVPPGGGVVLRHHHGEMALGQPVAALCRRRGLMLAVAGDAGFARGLEAAMVHNPQGEADGLLVSRSVHDADQAIAARGSDLVFVSPVFASRSHPGAEGLGIPAALELARLAAVPAIALGGMDETRGELAIAHGFHGWAAIDAWRNGPPLRS